jgi:hypothetical protein
MDEHVGPILAADEAVALRIIEPFDLAFVCHQRPFDLPSDRWRLGNQPAYLYRRGKRRIGLQKTFGYFLWEKSCLRAHKRCDAPEETKDFACVRGIISTAGRSLLAPAASLAFGTVHYLPG